MANTNNTNNGSNNSHSDNATTVTNPPNENNGDERKGDGTRTSKKKRQRKNGERQNEGSNPPPRRSKLYVPKVMLELMVSTTGNGTSIHFGTNHLCHRHNRLFTLDHIEQCDQLAGCGRIREYASRLKQQHILDWDKETRMSAITDFALLTI